MMLILKSFRLGFQRKIQKGFQKRSPKHSQKDFRWQKDLVTSFLTDFQKAILTHSEINWVIRKGFQKVIHSDFRTDFRN